MEPQTENNAPASIGLGIFAGIFKFLCALTLSQVGGFIFWCLSVVSVILIIIINYPKAKEVIKGIKNKE